MAKMKEYTEDTPAEVEVVVEKVESKPPELNHIALGIFKDTKAGLWKVVKFNFDPEGHTGDYKIVYETGFRDEANEAFRIQVSRLGLLG